MRQSAQIPPDIRAYAQTLLTSLPAQLLIPYIYPSFYSLHNMPPEVRFLLVLVLVLIYVVVGWGDRRKWRDYAACVAVDIGEDGAARTVYD